jgi:hypothetical protein
MRTSAGGTVPFAAGLLVACLFLLSACLPQEAGFRMGLGTNRISGEVVVPDADPTAGSPLVVALKHHHKFVSTDGGGAVTQPTAHVVQVGPGGTFSVDLPSDVIAIDLIFLAPDHLSDTFSFSRQLGIGNVTYRAVLVPMPDWRSHFYTYLSPRLEHLIVEVRYRLAPAEAKLLGEWLIAQNDRLLARRPRPPPP